MFKRYEIPKIGIERDLPPLIAELVEFYTDWSHWRRSSRGASQHFMNEFTRQRFVDRTFEEHDIDPSSDYSGRLKQGVELLTDENLAEPAAQLLNDILLEKATGDYHRDYTYLAAYHTIRPWLDSDGPWRYQPDEYAEAYAKSLVTVANFIDKKTTISTLDT